MNAGRAVGPRRAGLFRVTACALGRSETSRRHDPSVVLQTHTPAALISLRFQPGGAFGPCRAVRPREPARLGSEPPPTRVRSRAFGGAVPAESPAENALEAGWRLQVSVPAV